MNDSTSTLLRELGDDHGRPLPATPEEILRRGRQKQRRRQTGAAVAALSATVILGAGFAAAQPFDRGTSIAAPASSGAADVTWTDADSLPRLPVSASAGPRELRDGRASGFAHSEVGAVLAVIHLSQRTDPSVGRTVFEPTIREQVTGRGAVELLRRTREGHRADGWLGNGSRVEGYRLLRSDDDEVTVQVLVGKPPTATFAALNLTVAWAGGDWKLVAPEEGDWSRNIVAPEVGQYTPFPPQG